MSGRGEEQPSKGGGGRGGRNRNRGYNSSKGNSGGNNSGGNDRKTPRVGLCAALGDAVFTFGETNSIDLLRTSWETFYLHMNTLFGPDLSTELSKRKRCQIPEPTYSAETHALHETLAATRQTEYAARKAMRDEEIAALQEELKLPSSLTDQPWRLFHSKTGLSNSELSATALWWS